MEVKIYDGAESIGGSKIYLRDGAHGIFLDFGLNFSTSSLYFKEFISMRTIRGLNDPIEMGLLPRINVYRDDLKTSDMNFGDFEKIPVDAVLLTHAHMDHCGMIGYLDFSIPLVASPETLAFLKVYRDTKSKIENSVIYDVLREENEGALPILKSKSKEMGKDYEKIKKYFLLRKLIPTDTLGKDAVEFLHTYNKENVSRYSRENLIIGNMDDLPFKIRSHMVDHSIYGSVGYVVETDSGKVAYTGDFRMHGDRRESTVQFAEMARGSRVLIVEGTRVADDREHNYTTEEDVLNNSSEAVASEGGLVIADFSPRDFERLNMFARIAGESGRTLLVTEKDAYTIMALRAVGTEIDVENIGIYSKPRDRSEWWLKILNSSDLWADKFVSPNMVREEPENFILAFSLYDLPNLMDLKPNGGTYIYSSTEPFNEEMELDFSTLNNWLKRYNMKSVGFRFVDGKLEYVKGYHASGHADPEDIHKLIDTVNPEIIIPVHTTNPQWFEKEFGEKTIMLRNGESVDIP